MVGADRCTGAGACAGRQPHRRRGPRPEPGDVIRVGRTVELGSAWTRRAIRCRISACSRTPPPRRCSPGTRCSMPAPVHCRSTGRPDLLYDTFATQLAQLPEATRLFPGHEYLVRNLEFTLDREPDNQEATELLAHVRSTTADAAPRDHAGTGEARQTFFRLRIRGSSPDCGSGSRTWARPGRQGGVPEAARTAQRLVIGPIRRSTCAPEPLILTSALLVGKPAGLVHSQSFARRWTTAPRPGGAAVRTGHGDLQRRAGADEKGRRSGAQDGARDAYASARVKLQSLVAQSPQFAEAWNALGLHAAQARFLR